MPRVSGKSFGSQESERARLAPSDGHLPRILLDGKSAPGRHEVCRYCPVADAAGGGLNRKPVVGKLDRRLCLLEERTAGFVEQRPVGNGQGSIHLQIIKIRGGPGKLQFRPNQPLSVNPWRKRQERLNQPNLLRANRMGQVDPAGNPAVRRIGHRIDIRISRTNRKDFESTETGVDRRWDSIARPDHDRTLAILSGQSDPRNNDPRGSCRTGCCRCRIEKTGPAEWDGSDPARDAA